MQHAHRRHAAPLTQANPPLSALLDQRLGTDPDWRTHLDRLAVLAE